MTCPCASGQESLEIHYYAGLDPKRHQSDQSVEQRERISKVTGARIRRAL